VISILKTFVQYVNGTAPGMKVSREKQDCGIGKFFDWRYCSAGMAMVTIDIYVGCVMDGKRPEVLLITWGQRAYTCRSIVSV